MKSKKLEAAQPPNGCDHTKLPTFSIISQSKFIRKQLLAKLWDKERTVGNQNLYEQQNIPVATVLKFWAEVHAKSHPYGATFAVGSTSNAVASTTSRNIKEKLNFCAQNAQ